MAQLNVNRYDMNQNPWFDPSDPTASWSQGSGGVMQGLLAMALQKRQEAEQKRQFDMDYELRKQKQGWEAPGLSTEAELGAYTRAGVRPEVAATKQYPPEPRDPSDAEQKKQQIEYLVTVHKMDPRKAAEMVYGVGETYGPRAGYYSGAQSKNPMWDDLYEQVQAGTLSLEDAIGMYQKGQSKINPNQAVNEAKASYRTAYQRVKSEMEKLAQQAKGLPDDEKGDAAYISIEKRYKDLEKILLQLQGLQNDTTIANKPIPPALQQRLDVLGWGSWENWGEVPDLGEDFAAVDKSIPGPNGGTMVQGQGPDGKPVWVEINVPAKKK